AEPRAHVPALEEEREPHAHMPQLPRQRRRGRRLPHAARPSGTHAHSVAERPHAHPDRALHARRGGPADARNPRIPESFLQYLPPEVMKLGRRLLLQSLTVTATSRARADAHVPALLVSHGAPLFAGDHATRVAALRAWGKMLPMPKAIV